MMQAPRSTSANRSKIDSALLAVMANGEHLNHDNVAARAGISRRTVYRHFPDQSALRTGLWKLLTPGRGMPKSLEELLEGMATTFAGFDARGDEMTVAMASPEGRAMRNLLTPERVAAYRAAFAESTASLPEPDRTWAIAAMQLMASGFAWREMRDQWGMDAAAITIATRWAIKAMLADLKRRGNKPLADGPA